jgi:hypothetical protein
MDSNIAFDGVFGEELFKLNPRNPVGFEP